jgi:hypothetical protein
MKLNLITSTTLIVSILVTGCNFNSDNTSPTPDAILEQPINPLPEAILTSEATFSTTPSPESNVIESAEIELYTPSPTTTPFATDTLVPSQTPGHWEYVIQPGDQLGAIIQKPPFNYQNWDVLQEIIRINDNIANADSLPPPGSTILIPRPTATAIASGSEATAVLAQHANLGQYPPNTVFDCHTVQEGETLISIIEQYPVTLEIISQLNRDIDFRGCDFEEPGGGPNCNPLISVGQCVVVPFPTPTPTLTSTPSGNETPTPTPTFAVPSMIFPPEDSIVPPGIIALQWVSVGTLQPEEYYLVQVVDVTAGTQPWVDITKSNSMTLPDTLIPTDGQTHVIEWTVFVAKPNEQGLFAPVGGIGAVRTFQWQSR